MQNRKPTKAELIQLGVISLLAGGGFLYAGIMLAAKVISRGVNPGFPGIFVIGFCITVGVILLIISLKTLVIPRERSTFSKEQKISAPILTFAGIFFIAVAGLISVLVFLGYMSTSAQVGRGIGCGFVIGGIALWAGRKKST